MSLLGLAADRHVRRTPRAPRRRLRYEHVDEAHRAAGDNHRCRRRLLEVSIAFLPPLHRGGDSGGRRGRRGGRAVGPPPGSLEGGPHLIEGADALVPGGRRHRVMFGEEIGGGRRGKREVEVVVAARRWMRFALVEVGPSGL